MKTSRIMFRTGKRIYLRPVLKSDLETLVVWINDPDITQYLKATFPLAPHHEEKWYEEVMNEHGKSVTLAVVHKKNDALIGIMSLNNISYMHGRATTGSLLGKPYWNKGYGTEAKLLLLEYAFTVLNLRKICSSVYATNPRSKKCLEKCGYREEGILKEHVYKNGKYTDIYKMAVFKEEFMKLL